MSMLKDFHEKSFIKKVTILNEIEKNKNQEMIPDLLEICKKSDPSDQALFMAENTLRALLKEDESQTVQGISSESDNVKKICIQICSQKKFKSAAPVLISLLSDLTQKEDKDDEIFDILSALSKMKTSEVLEIFQKYITHDNPIIAELSIETIGSYGDIDSINLLSEIVKNSENNGNLEESDIITASAIEALGKIKNDEVISFLSSVIHHKNPNTRRIIHRTLIEIGQEIIPEISKHFDQNNVDNKIMSANILGQIGGKKAGDILITAIDNGAADHPNIMVAIYEALSNIPSMKSIVCLADGLYEHDELLLVGVVSSIDKQINPGIIETIKKLILAGDDQSKRLIKAIVISKTLAIFESVYDDEKIGNSIIETIGNSNNSNIISTFTEKLESINSDKSASDAEKIKQVSTKKLNKSILAVDDSKAMILFYQSTISEMNHNVETAFNGQEAYGNIDNGKKYDMIITDMNMPIMDGVELTRKIRIHETMGNVPIIMATTESENSQVEIAEKAGVNIFLKKPFSADDLKNKIRAVLNG